MPRITKVTTGKPQVVAKKRVAAYARVSEDTEMLLHSLSAQVSYYSSLIQKNPAWEYAGVYADAGITGTSVAHRDEFKRLIADCEARKIDLVLVKSISRFARDTVDCLNTTRRLKRLGVAVQFEREKINSLTDEGELMLSLLASFAQEESRSISENVKWSTRKRFKEGIPNGRKVPYGYRWDGDKYRIIPTEGEVVKEIYSKYLAGESAYSIAKELAERGVTGRAGHPIEQTTVKDILSNQSYTGTMVLQKNYFTDSHVRKRNKGELPMYLVDDVFEPLVTEEDYQTALEIRQQRAEQFPSNKSSRTEFSGKVKCGYCGCSVCRRTAGGRKRWVCNTRARKGAAACECRPIWETELESAAANVAHADLITLYNDRIEFTTSGKRCKTISREYSGGRGQNAFTGKVWCGICGGKCEKHNKAWSCTYPHGVHKTVRLAEAELLKAAGELLKGNYLAKVAAEVERVVIFDDHVDFEYKDGMMKTWHRG